jgi:hypothetical protein
MSENADDRKGTPSRDQDRIPASSTIVKLCLIVVASMLFNYHPDKVGLIRSVTDPSFTPLLAPEFKAYLPWLNLWWGLTFSLNLAHLTIRRWTAATRSADIALHVLSAVLFGWLVLGEPFIVVPLVSALVKIALAVACFVTLIETGKQLDRLLDGTRVAIQWKEKDGSAR